MTRGMHEWVRRGATKADTFAVSIPPERSLCMEVSQCEGHSAAEGDP